MADRDDDKEKDDYGFNTFRTWFDDFIEDDPVLSGVEEPSPVNIKNVVFDIYDQQGDDPKFGQYLSKYASEKTLGVLSPEDIAKTALYGPTALNKVKEIALNAYNTSANNPTFPGIQPILQGASPVKNIWGTVTGYEPVAIPMVYDEDSGTMVPLAVPTGDVTVTPSYLGILNSQPSSGMVGSGGGQPYHHISGLLKVMENLSGDNQIDLGTVLGRIIDYTGGNHPGLGNVVAGLDDEDKLASAWT